MIHDLMDLFRITSEPEASSWVDLDAAVAEALDRLAPQIAAKHVRVHVDTLPAVWGQRGKLAHVVTNLLANAVKYVSADRGVIEVTGSTERDAVVLCVADNGIGIPAHYHEAVLKLFGRVPAPEQVVDGVEVAGSGVGLAIVQWIVDAHGGTVHLDSAPGRGSRFTVRLPLHDAVRV
jgi:signal transduction histidine kinase